MYENMHTWSPPTFSTIQISVVLQPPTHSKSCGGFNSKFNARMCIKKLFSDFDMLLIKYEILFYFN
ncbi:hypothetical protein BLOT_003071 [Blomia tropicalis]|nr:hypothetical protein BLOT_003071 [Blomia tropicalis]